MKVVQVNCVYNKGSTGKIVYDIHQLLVSKGDESIVCYGRGACVTEKGVHKTCGELYSKFNNLITRFTGVMYGGCFFSTNQLISIIKKEQPDVVHLHCLNGYFVNIYRLIEWLKKQHIRTILTLHAEFMYTANCGHALDCEKWKTGCGNCSRLREETGSLLIDGTAKSWKKMKYAFDGFEDDLLVVSVSPWLMKRAKASPILENFEHKVVLNGLDDDVFKYYNREKLKEEYGFAGEKLVFHATPNFNNDPNHIKGGYYVIKLAEQMKDIKFLVAGNYDKAMNLPKNVITLGNVTDKVQLAKYYAMADVNLLTSKRETFSMVVAEGLCCGTPVVGFNAGAPEQITIPEYSEFVEYGNIEKLKDSVNNVLDADFDAKEVSNCALEKYSKKKMFEEYSKLYRRG